MVDIGPPPGIEGPALEEPLPGDLGIIMVPGAPKLPAPELVGLLIGPPIKPPGPPGPPAARPPPPAGPNPAGAGGMLVFRVTVTGNT